MNTDDVELNDITRRIIGCAYAVGLELGTGYLEKVYENALVYEMRRRGLAFEQQVPLNVFYHDVVVGQFTADLIVEARVLVELKACTCKGIEDAHVAQCLNYLKTTGLRVCLLLNFGTPKVQIKRLVL